MNQKYEKAKFSDVFKYSFGGLGSNLAFFLVMSFLTFFYTDIFGISSYVVATLMLISRFIDAFTDPIMGMLGDNTRSKMGKYRPWIIFGAPVLGVLIFLLFTAPEMSPTMKVVYAYVIYILYSLASTVVNIPYHALTPVLSEDPQQRTEIVAWKQGMGTVSQFVITILALPLVELFGGGKQGWALYGALIGIMTTVSFWICAWGGKKYDKVDCLLVVVHLLSKKTKSNEAQYNRANDIARELNKYEQEFFENNKKRTIIVGDFNMQPYEAGICSGYGFNATMSASHAAKKTRKIDGRTTYLYFNPIWALMGANKLVQGSYYNSGDKDDHAIYWYSFDSVLLRPCYIDKFNWDYFEIIEKTENHNFVPNTTIDKEKYSDHLPIKFEIIGG